MRRVGAPDAVPKVARGRPVGGALESLGSSGRWSWAWRLAVNRNIPESTRFDRCPPNALSCEKSNPHLARHSRGLMVLSSSRGARVSKPVCVAVFDDWRSDMTALLRRGVTMMDPRCDLQPPGFDSCSSW